MKNRSINMLIVALLLIAALSVTLITFLAKAKEDFPKDIRVNADGESETILAVRDLKLNPSESKCYEVNLYCAASGSYYISLDYEEVTNGGMKSFIDVTVKCGDVVVYKGNLGALLDADVQVQFLGELHETEPVVISVCYEMPREIGNEAQSTYAEFDVCLKIKKA